MHLDERTACVNLVNHLASWPGQPAVAVVDTAGTVAMVGPQTSYPWASVTKLVTSTAALVAVDRGLLDLDEPAGPPGATVRHLLAHASGIAPDGDAALAPPGRRRIYSNRGFELLADVVSARVGASFADWTYEAVVRPLGMSAMRVEGSPAHGISGTIADLAALGRELLRPTILEQQTWATATSVAFPGLDGVLPGFGKQRPNDWGLGFELRDGKDPHWTGSTNSPRTFGHFGRSGSFLWVDPEAQLACASLSGQPFGPWAAAKWPRLSDDVVSVYASQASD
jgi:CubicO group peptidase (beta-lactamase class C family)